MDCLHKRNGLVWELSDLHRVVVLFDRRFVCSIIHLVCSLVCIMEHIALKEELVFIKGIIQGN